MQDLTTERIATLEKEIERLRKIVDKLPLTADGVPVVPGSDHVFRIAIGDEFDEGYDYMKDGIEESCNWYGWGATFASDMGRRFPESRICHDPSIGCYSTHAAALAAKVAMERNNEDE